MKENMEKLGLDKFKPLDAKSKMQIRGGNKITGAGKQKIKSEIQDQTADTPARIRDLNFTFTSDEIKDDGTECFYETDYVWSDWRDI